MSRTGWKAFERHVAAIFGTTRVGPVGKNGPDVVTDLFSVECRERATITFTNIEAWTAEVRRESEAGRVPVLALRRCKGMGRRAGTFFVLDEEAWVDLHGSRQHPFTDPLR